MPFRPQAPRPYTKADVEQLAPNQSGVYGIFREGISIYIGRGDIRARLLSHLNGDNPAVEGQMPTHWVAEVTPNDVGREQALLQEYDPICNREMGQLRTVPVPSKRPVILSK